jgi:hypothetical protein
VNLLAEVITQGASRIHEEFAKFFYAEYCKESLKEKDSSLAALHGIQECFIMAQNSCAKATEGISRLVTKTAKHRLATLKDLEHRSLQWMRKLGFWN